MKLDESSLLAAVNERLTYHRDTGTFTWRVSIGHGKNGALAGTVRKPTGMMAIGLFGKKIPIHRLVWLVEHGKFPKLMIDHIDGDASNNRITNLREATDSQNMQNSRLYSTNASGHRGVSWDQRRSKWKAAIGLNGVKQFLGHFKGLEDAAAAYKQAQEQLHPFRPIRRLRDTIMEGK